MSCVDQLLATKTSFSEPAKAAAPVDGTTAGNAATSRTATPARPNEACQAPTKPTTMFHHDAAAVDDGDDEFGDFPDFDLEILDAISKQRSLTSIQSAVPPPEIRREEQSAAEDQLVYVDATTIAPYKPSTVVIKQEEPQEHDEFGDFPDFDMSTIDQVIATRSTQTTTGRMVPTTIPPDSLSTEVVRNKRSHSTDPSGLSFIKFSRYKVLTVHVDSVRFYKTIVLAAWTNNMLQDDCAKINIHQNHHVEERVHHGETALCRRGLPPPRLTQYPEAGYLQLRGQWYYTELQPGDSIHVCSLTGRYRTDPGALPIVLHSHPPAGSEQDDLVIIHHPDLLMTPTVICETVSCPRRAVLKQRNGSTGLTAKSALIGNLRHALFGWCIKEQNFGQPLVVQQIQKIIRENAEAMVGCGVTSKEAEMQLLGTVPTILDFIKAHTTFLSPHQATMTPRAFVQGHIGCDKGVRFAAHATYSLEEPVVSPELALKGFVDAVLETTTITASNEHDRGQQTITGRHHSLMALELKTGHNQTSQHTHMGQLSLYTLMLQGRYGSKTGSAMVSSCPSRTTAKPDPEGAAAGGILLYLNQQSSKATHVAPGFHEFKSLIGQRNIIASELLKASKPRGVALAYEDENPVEGCNAGKQQKVFLLQPAPPVELPEVQPSERSCARCFENRTCMLYARSETEVDDRSGVRQSHGELLAKFTGMLVGDDLEYFRKWDRLIDLDADATVGNAATAWLVDSHTRETTTGQAISSLVYSGPAPSPEGSGILLRFKRASLSPSQAKLDRLSIGIGSHVVVSTDGSIFDDSQSDPKLEYLNTQRERKKFRQRMNVVRGFLKVATSDEIFVSANREDLDRLQDIQGRFSKLSIDDGNSPLLFRVDKDDSAVGIGTLRQNLINMFTADARKGSNEDPTPLEVAVRRRLPRLRNFVVRLEPPSFRTISDATLFQAIGPPIPGCDPQMLSQEFHALNSDQQDAVRKVGRP
jgi:DNA replication factor Dna2